MTLISPLGDPLIFPLGVSLISPPTGESGGASNSDKSVGNF